MAEAYLALIHPPEGGANWGVTFPDFEGCVSAGDTFEQAWSHAREALGGHIAALRADGDVVPPPSSYDRIVTGEAAEDIAGGARIVLVEPSAMPAPKERINVMMDRAVLRRVDAAARAEGVTRSAFIERAATSRLER